MAPEIVPLSIKLAVGGGQKGKKWLKLTPTSKIFAYMRIFAYLCIYVCSEAERGGHRGLSPQARAPCPRGALRGPLRKERKKGKGGKTSQVIWPSSLPPPPDD